MPVRENLGMGIMSRAQFQADTDYGLALERRTCMPASFLCQQSRVLDLGCRAWGDRVALFT